MKKNKKNNSQKKSSDMNKKVFLPLVFLMALSSAFAQVQECPFENVAVSKDVEVKDATSMFEVVTGTGQQKAVEGFRNLFFIHGLGGDASAWVMVEQACHEKNLSGSNVQDFPARKFYPFSFDYNDKSKGEVWAAATKVRGNIEEKAAHNMEYHNVDPNTGILIAHSQGGIVCRALMHKDFVSDVDELPDFGKGYGGLVTVASSLQGARILNNRQLIKDMANDACNSLLAYPVQNSSLIAKIIIKRVIGNVENLCNIASGPVLNLFFSDYYNNITASYVIGGEKSKIDTFNLYADHHPNYPEFCDMPKVAFYAVEPQENIMWRTANWLINNPNDQDHFGANDDWSFYKDTIESIYLDYVANYQHWKAEYNRISTILKWTGWYLTSLPAGLTDLNKAKKKMEAAKKGVDWFDKANEDWKVVIGAKEYKTNPFGIFLPPIVILKPENDGIVLAESAKGLPCATHPPVEICPKKTVTYSEISPLLPFWCKGKFETEFSKGGTYTVKLGSSHMQVRNDIGIKEHLFNLFEGNYDPWFKTEKK